MVHYVYGAAGTGKTQAMLKYLESDVKQGKKAFFIVPEQETVAVERQVVSLFPASAQLSVEVLNFSRLCNRIFRTYGGISYNFATKPVKALVMWNTIRELSPMLEEYKTGEPSDFSLTEKMLSAATELKAYCIAPEKLDLTSSKIERSSALYGKLRDISLIYSAYTSKMNELFNDTSDDISKAIDVLCDHNPFEGASVYIDSFAGFTKQEFEFISVIANKCEELYITLPISSPNDLSIHFESVRQTAKKLKKTLSDLKYDEQFLTENHRAGSDELKYLAENVWNFEAPSYSRELDGSLGAYLCDTPYSEVEIAASEICKAVSEGARYNEIAIIVRNAEKYRGILDVALEKYGIPYFMSEKTDLLSKPLAKFIFSALKIKETNWKGSNVIAHLKSGFCDVDPYDVDVFEDYVSTWRINGSKFLGEKWTMNPDGYSASLTKRGERILKTANSVKESTVAPLSLYFTRLDASKNVKEMCGATVEYLKDLKITEKVRLSCEKNLSLGNKKAADEDMKLYSLTLNLLYDLSNVYGEETFTFEEFSSALSLMFSESDIGTIPTSADEVIVGSANMLRAGRIKRAVILGLNEGEFPASVKDNGIFTDSDKEILESFDISLSADTNTRTAEELFYLYRAISTPQSKLILTCSALSSDGSSQRQSIAFDRLKKLFPSLAVTKEASLSPIHKVWSKETLRELYPSLCRSESAKEIREMISSGEGGDAFLDRLEIPISKTECTVSSSSLKEIFGKRLSLTQSRLEKYVLCGFDYYCSYVLSLRESKRAVFQLNDIGTFIHYILEMFMKEITADNKLNLTLTDEEIDAILSRVVHRYLLELLGESYAISNRTKHLFARLNKLSFMIAKNLISEFKESDFYPSRFELKVGMGEGGIDALEFELKDGTTVALRGIADRVDTYKKDGNVYIRIVDYKTGSKEFSFDDLKEGLNTQLLIYLYSICRSDNPETKRIFGCEDGKLLPAGIQYLSSNAPVVSVDRFCEGNEVEKLIQNEFSRSGLLNSEPDVLRAMNHSLDPKIISKYKTDDEGNLIGKSLVDDLGFDDIYGVLAETIVRIAESMKDGKADAIPLHKGDKAPCRYCKMKSICRASACKNKL